MLCRTVRCKSNLAQEALEEAESPMVFLEIGKLTAKFAGLGLDLSGL